MLVLNNCDRYTLVADVIKRVPKIQPAAGHLMQEIRDKLIEHHHYVRDYGQDMPEVKDWQWPQELTKT